MPQGQKKMCKSYVVLFHKNFLKVGVLEVLEDLKPAQDSDGLPLVVYLVIGKHTYIIYT